MHPRSRYGLAIFIAVVVFWIGTALFVKADTEVAARAISQGTPFGRFILWSLHSYYGMGDPKDLTATGLSQADVVERCRDRANLLLSKVLLAPTPFIVAIAMFLRFVPRHDV